MSDTAPLQRRRRLGRELRKLRVTAGLSGPELARRMGTTQTRVSRIETAVVRPKVADVHAWCETTGASGELHEQLVKLAQDALTELSGWQAIFRGSLAERQRELMALDRAASQLRHFQPYLVPGPLQSEEYARVAINAGNFTGETDVEAAVAARLERGRQLLSSRTSHYHVIVTEAALRWTPRNVSPGMKKAMWGYLIEVSRRTNVTLRAIPIDTEMDMPAMVGFTIVTLRDPEEPPVVRMETPAVHMAFSGAEQVATFELVWERMLAATLDPEDTRRFLAALHE